MSHPIWCLPLQDASKFEMSSVLELRGMDHMNLVCQTCWPNAMPTADPLPMTADAISHQTSVGYHLLINNRQREREKQDLGHWEAERKSERRAGCLMLPPQCRGIYVEKYLPGNSLQLVPICPPGGSWPVCSQSPCQVETFRRGWEIQLH